MNRTRAQAGSYAQKKGMTFEDEIKRVNELVANHGHGAIWHAHAASKLMSGQILWAAKGPFDWFGLLDGGIPVYFESKQREFKQQSMPTRCTLSEKDEHQLVALRAVARYSQRALCFVLFNWIWIYNDEIASVEMRLHPIQTIPERTILRERGLIAPNRNWFQAAMSEQYQEAARVGFIDYAIEEMIPV